MSGDTDFTPPGLPTLEEMQHWTWVFGRAQQMMLEHAATMAQQMAQKDMPALTDPQAFQAKLPAWMGSMPQAMLDAQAPQTLQVLERLGIDVVLLFRHRRRCR